MKTTLALAVVLAAVAVVCDSSAIKASPRADLIVGNIVTGDRLLYKHLVHRYAVPNAVQFEDVIWHGNATTRITAIRASELGGTQNASAWIIAGGVGRNNVTVRFQSYRGYGYYYQLDIWGR